MKRRALLASAGVGVASLSGCLFGGGGDDESETTTTESGTQPIQDVDKSGANLRLASIDAPESVELNAAYTFELTVTNEGETAGVYRAPVTVQRNGEVQFRQAREALVYVEPGETQTATVSVRGFDELGRANIRVDGASNQWGIQVTRRRLPFGGTFVSNNMAITIDRVELDSGQGNEQSVYVYVRVRNTGQQNYAPPPDSFYVRYEGARYDKDLYGSKSPEYYDVNLRQGQTEAGIVTYTLPASATVDDLRVEYARGDQEAVWLKPDGSSGADTSDGSGDGGSADGSSN